MKDNRTFTPGSYGHQEEKSDEVVWIDEPLKPSASDILSKPLNRTIRLLTLNGIKEIHANATLSEWRGNTGTATLRTDPAIFMDGMSEVYKVSADGGDVTGDICKAVRVCEGHFELRGIVPLLRRIALLEKYNENQSDTIKELVRREDERRASVMAQCARAPE